MQDRGTTNPWQAQKTAAIQSCVNMNVPSARFPMQDTCIYSRREQKTLCPAADLREETRSVSVITSSRNKYGRELSNDL